MLEIENAVVVVVFIFLKHIGLCGRLADSNYFYTEASIACTNFCVCIVLFTCMLCAWLWPCMQFVKVWICSIEILKIIFHSPLFPTLKINIFHKLWYHSSFVLSFLDLRVFYPSSNLCLCIAFSKYRMKGVFSISSILVLFPMKMEMGHFTRVVIMSMAFTFPFSEYSSHILNSQPFLLLLKYGQGWSCSHFEWKPNVLIDLSLQF